MNRNRIIVVAAGAAVLLATTGTALAIGAGDAAPSAPAGAVLQPTSSSTTESTDDSSTPTTAPTSSKTSTETSTPTHTPTAVPDGGIGRERAIGIAVARAGGGTVTNVEWEVEHGRIEWKIRVVNGGNRTDVRVDAATGTVTRVDAKDDDRSGRGGGDDHGDDNSGRGRGRGGDDH